MRGGPAPSVAAARVSQCILVSAYKKRPRGGLWRRGGIPVNGLRAFLILENRKRRDFSMGFRFLRGEGKRPNCSA